MMPSIFQVERRAFREAVEHRMARERRKRLICHVAVGVLLATLCYLLSNVHLPEGPVTITPSVTVHGITLSQASFCQQAIADHEVTGEAMSPDLISYCGL